MKPSERGGLRRVRGAGLAARLTVASVACLFLLTALGRLFWEGDPWRGPAGALVVGCVAVLLRTARVGIWVDDSTVVFRLFWRTLSVPRAELRGRVVPYSSIWYRGAESWFLSMLAVEYRGRERDLAFTMGRRRTLKRLLAMLRMDDEAVKAIDAGRRPAARHAHPTSSSAGCPDCGHRWDEHAGSGNDDDGVCGECAYEIEHDQRPPDAPPPCRRAWVASSVR